MSFCNLADAGNGIKIRHLQAIDIFLAERGIPLIEVEPNANMSKNKTLRIDNATYSEAKYGLGNEEDSILMLSPTPIIRPDICSFTRNGKLGSFFTPMLEDRHTIRIVGNSLVQEFKEADVINLNCTFGVGVLSPARPLVLGDHFVDLNNVVRYHSSNPPFGSVVQIIEAPALLRSFAIGAVRKLAAHERDTSGKMGRLNLTAGWEEVIERYMP